MMSKITKCILMIPCFVMAAVLIRFTVWADTVNLYANLDDSNTNCNILIDAMYNDPKYDPYNQYAVMRTGEYEYRVYFGEDLNGSELVYYQFVPAQYQTPATLSRGTASSLTINRRGYYFVGNVDGALSSSQAENYKVGAIITIAAIIIVFLLLFRTFRKSEGRKAKYYSVKG